MGNWASKNFLFPLICEYLEISFPTPKHNRNKDKYVCCNEWDSSDEDSDIELDTFYQVNKNHLPGKKCKINKNCIQWYSTEHHALFCPKRVEVLNDYLFLPKIDQNLLQRFLEMFEIDEKYSILLSASNGPKLVKLEPILIDEGFNNGDKQQLRVVLLNDHMTLYNSNLTKDRKLFNSISANTILCFPRDLKITSSELSSEMLLQLLSPYTKKFNLRNSTCKPNISFSDIIKKAPNLINVSIYNFETNIIYEKTWIKNLVKYKNGKNFNKLVIKLDSLELDVKSLVKFVETICSQTIVIRIAFNQPLLDEDLDGSKFREIVKKLEQYFEYHEDESSFLHIGYDSVDGYEVFSLETIKQQKRIMPPRAATKRKYVYNYV